MTGIPLDTFNRTQAVNWTESLYFAINRKKIDMNRFLKTQIFLRILVALMLTGLLTLWQPSEPVTAQNSSNNVLYTTDADFDSGTSVSVNHNAPNNNQLQLDSQTKPFPFINVAASGRGTVVRTNTETGEIVGEYRTAPEGRGLNPSRTTVDLFGNVWTANRDESGMIGDVLYGSTVKIGLLVGGTRVNEDGSPNPDGGYLAPPFGYNTCVDRNADGLIHTSKGLDDILDWPDITDGMGGTDGIVQDAVDECVLLYQRLPNAENPRHVSVDADNNVWVGGYPYAVRTFYKLDGDTGAFLDSFDAREIGCGGYGGLIDGNGILWSVGGALLRYNPVAHTGFCIQQYGYGLGIDTNGYIWMSLWDGGIVKIAPDGTVVPGFPKPTFPSSMTALSMAMGMDNVAAIPQNAPAGNASDSRTAGDRIKSLKLPSTTHSNRQTQPVQNTTFLPENDARVLNEPLAEDPSVTFQVAPVDNWVQSSSSWTPGATITMTIRDSGSVVYADSQIADAGGNFNFNLWDKFDLQRGQEVTVSDGTHTKTHTVMNLFVGGVDITANTVFGSAEAGTNVQVWVHQGGWLSVAPDGSGDWTADFSSQIDLNELSDGGSRQYDSDGDSTGVWWATPRIQVAPDDNWVQSWMPWTSGAAITLTIQDGGDVVYSDSQTADTEGRFNFNLWNGNFDLRYGQVVTVSDGTTTKTHTVMPLYVDKVDLAADTVSGRAETGKSVEVWVNGGGWMAVTPESSGEWTADFSSQTDLTWQTDGGSRQMDADGDTTQISWSSPRFWVSPDDNWVQSRNGWAPGATITLTIAEGGVVVHSDSQIADEDGNFNFNLWDDNFDLQRGQVVTISDGTITKAHTVMPLYVNGVNVNEDTIFGRADADTEVDVWVHGDGNRLVKAGDGGSWIANFTGQTDITYKNDGGSAQYDDDGDGTGVWWNSPRIQVAPEDDWVQSQRTWTPGSTITLTIKAGGTVKYTDSQIADEDGNFNFNLWDVFDLKRGQEVIVSDGMSTKTHVVMPLYVDVVNVATDTISGRGDASSDVEVWVHGDGNVTTTPNDSGNWTADFSGQTDLTYLNDGGSAQYDDDGDSTGVWWSSPRFWVAPDDNWVQSNTRWTPGATITLTIAEGGVVKYTNSQTADSQGNFYFDLGGGSFDLKRGQVVTVSDGTITKTHTVMPFYVDGVNVTDDIIYGRADAGTDVDVWVHGDGNMLVTADGTGHWTADFTDQTDLTYLNDGGSAQYDDDGDGTGVWWASPNIQVSPDENWVQQWNRWTPGTTVTLTIAEGGVVKYTDSQTVDTYGNFNFNVWGVDLNTGHVVTVSDGTTTKTHTVTNVNVTDIDMNADQIHGSANPGARVRVWVYDFSNGSERIVTADGAGNWAADFSTGADGQPAFDITDATFVSINEFDDDGDSTWRRAGALSQGSTGVAVTHSDNNVWVANRNSGTVTRLDNDGNVLKMIPTGQVPTGVAVDAAGKVWATNMNSDNAVRIDPNADTDNLGAVDLTVDLGPGASPYNYSDMTGTVVVGSTSPQGFWTVVQDGGTPGFGWGRIVWNTEPEGNEPSGTEIVVEARAADTEAGLGGQTFQPITNGVLFSMSGRFIEVRVTLKASTEGVSPILSDICIQSSNQPPTIISLVAPTTPGQINQAINAVVTFEDPDPGDSHTAEWDWGDGSTSTLAATLPSNSASHIYTAPGVYILSVTITDAAGASDTESFQYIVVYDPNGGFVTGGGWINSPLGAYTLDPTLTGKATFGFVSKYQKGASVPTGSTEFQFHVANMNFKSTSYDWLVIAGTKAQYKGTGTINSAGEYKFMLTAIDGTLDKFRIKIWDTATGEVIYDNQLGAIDTADPATDIQGGSIVIHKAK